MAVAIVVAIVLLAGTVPRPSAATHPEDEVSARLRALSHLHSDLQYQTAIRDLFPDFAASRYPDLTADYYLPQTSPLCRLSVWLRPRPAPRTEFVRDLLASD